jgi:hypothetical protein
MSSTVKICTMPGCFSQAFQVDGLPIEHAEKGAVSPWELCNCCYESVLGASQALKQAGIESPNDAQWCLEAARSWIQRAIKVEALKKS